MGDADILKRVPLLAGFEPEDMATLATKLRRRRYRKQEVIFHRDDPGNCLYIVLSGAVKIGLSSEDGKEVILTILGPGDSFGELTLLDGDPRSADATALEAAELLALPRDTFLQFIRTNPEAALRLMAALSRQFRRLTDTVHDSAFLDVPGRLARALLQLGVAAEEPAVVRTREMTQSDLAALIGATRESVNKCLASFERLGLISREKGRIAVLNPEALERRIQ